MATLTFSKSGPAPEPEPTPPTPQPKQYETVTRYFAEFFLGQATTGGNYREKSLMRSVVVEFDDQYEYEAAANKVFMVPPTQTFLQFGNVMIRASEITYVKFFSKDERRVLNA